MDAFGFRRLRRRRSASSVGSTTAGSRIRAFFAPQRSPLVPATPADAQTAEETLFIVAAPVDDASPPLPPKDIGARRWSVTMPTADVSPLSKSLPPSTRLLPASPSTPTRRPPVPTRSVTSPMPSPSRLLKSAGELARKGQARLAAAHPSLSPASSRRSSMSTIGPPPSRQVFGAPLNETGVPAVALRCMAFVELHSERGEIGLYRVPGANSQVQRLRRVFNDRDADVCLTLRSASAQIDPHVAASCFKVYLRELPDSLLTAELEEKFDAVFCEHTGAPATSRNSLTQVLGALSAEQAARSGPAALSANLGRLVPKLRALLLLLPPAHFQLLSEIAHHLGRIMAHSATTLMTLDSLRLILSPTLRMGPAMLQVLVEQRTRLFAPPMSDADDDGVEDLSLPTEADEALDAELLPFPTTTAADTSDGSSIRSRRDSSSPFAVAQSVVLAARRRLSSASSGAVDRFRTGSIRSRKDSTGSLVSLASIRRAPWSAVDPRQSMIDVEPPQTPIADTFAGIPAPRPPTPPRSSPPYVPNRGDPNAGTLFSQRPAGSPPPSSGSGSSGGSSAVRFRRKAHGPPMMPPPQAPAPPPPRPMEVEVDEVETLPPAPASPILPFSAASTVPPSPSRSSCAHTPDLARDSAEDERTDESEAVTVIEDDAPVPAEDDAASGGERDDEGEVRSIEALRCDKRISDTAPTLRLDDTGLTSSLFDPAEFDLFGQS